VRGLLNDGAAYDPVGDVWCPLRPATGVEPRRRAAGVWTGSALLVWGGEGEDGAALARGAVYVPSLRR